MNALIVGGGSMGLLLASKMDSSQTTLCTRSDEQAERINKDGVLCVSGQEQRRFDICAMSWNQVIRSGRKWDVVMLTLKQTQLTPQLLQGVQKITHAYSQLVAFQNGMGHVEKMLPYFHREQLWLAVTTDGANRLQGNVVAHTGKGQVRIGCVDSSEIRTEMWHKLIVNAVINPMTAIHSIKNGELVASDKYYRQMRALYDEAVQVAHAEGVIIRADHWQTVLDVCRITSGNESSMLQDRKYGRQTEIASINGYVLNVAEKHQLDLPAHTEVVNLLT